MFLNNLVINKNINVVHSILPFQTFWCFIIFAYKIAYKLCIINNDFVFTIRLHCWQNYVPIKTLSMIQIILMYQGNKSSGWSITLTDKKNITSVNILPGVWFVQTFLYSIFIMHYSAFCRIFHWINKPKPYDTKSRYHFRDNSLSVSLNITILLT